LPQTAASPTENSLDDALLQAFNLCQGCFLLLALGTAILMAASVACAATVIGVVGLLPLWGGLLAVGLRVAAGRPIEFDDFFSGLRAGVVPLVLLGLVLLPAVALGTALLVVPGVYVGLIACYAPLLVLDRGQGLWEALGNSTRAVHSRLLEHIGLLVVLGVINLVATLPFGLGLLLTLPYSAVALGVAYTRLLGYAGGLDRQTA
jgi:uncharacterized membrane protein